jgi:hypothetical protein
MRALALNIVNACQTKPQYTTRAHSLRRLVLEKHNPLKQLKISKDETFGASHFHTRCIEDDRLEKHVRSMTTDVNPTYKSSCS